MGFIMMVLQAWMLVMALGIDSFACSLGYGTNKIKIPFKSVVTIAIICSILLTTGLLFGTVLGNVLSESATTWISFTILFLLGLSKVFDSAIKGVIRKYNGINKNFQFSLFNLGFVLNVFANPEEADVDNSKVLSPREAAPLAIALGIDGLSVGFGIGLAAVNVFLIIGLCFISDLFFVTLGSKLGNKIAQKLSMDLSWLSGVILILIAMTNVL